ncbi:MAG: FecR family protein [Deltaproteobacteria bacterium]|nr:FecR family protein [Deltaproteobacteria bacterium]
MNPPRFALHLFAVFCLGFVLSALTAAPAPAATSDIGQVVTYTPGASILRDGKTEPLALRSGIRVSDTIETNASGRVRILFDDDTSVSLGPNTTMEMSEYADAGSASAFGVRLGQGVIRAITGKIVDQNPSGFKMTSPEATVGIRGTIVSMRRQRDSTTVYVENTLRRVHVNNIDVPSGYKTLVAPGVRPSPVPIQREDRRSLGRDLAFRGGAGSVAAAPEPDTNGTQTSTTQLPTGGSLAPQETLLADAGVAQSLIAENLKVSTTGYVSGSSNFLPDSMSFSFDVNLSSGQISNGTLNHSSTSANGGYGSGPVSAFLSGGKGTADAVGFTMSVSGPAIASGFAGTNGPYVASAIVSGIEVNLLSIPSSPFPPASSLPNFPIGYGITYSDSSPTPLVIHDVANIGGNASITKK